MWPYPKILAHRGGGKLAPENTIAALRCGLAHGYRAVEFDAMLARDGVPVVIHDPVLGRTVSGSGYVSDYDAAELAEMDAGRWFGNEFAGERVPTFAAFARFCVDFNIWMNIEIKPAPGFDEQTGRVVALAARELHPHLPPLLSSFSETALAAAMQAAPELPRGLLFDRIPRDWQQRAAALGVVAVHVNQKHLTAPLAQAIRAAGYGLFCYTVNDVDRAREIIGWGVNAFCTDRIDLFKAEQP